MRLLGIDLETTGFDNESDQITEMGIVIKDWGNKKPLTQEVTYLYEEDYPVISDEIVTLTGITKDHLLEMGLPPQDAFNKLCDLIEALSPDYIVAHNGKKFDAPFLEAKMKEHGDLPMPDLHWLDTRVDIEYPSHIKGRSLLVLAAEHGFLNPFPHDALSDVNTMFKILEQYDIHKVIARSTEADVFVEAVVSYDNRELARRRGYQWYPKTKKWCRLMKESELIIEHTQAPFSIREVSRDEISATR